MAIQFYYASGSPYAWRVWLALEFKALPYDLKTLSFDAGDLKTGAFAAINPRQRVPAIIDDDFRLYESAAIVEYLDDAYPTSGSPLFPDESRAKAVVRRLVCEADHYLSPALEEMVEAILRKPPPQRDAAAVRHARDAFVEQLRYFESSSLPDGPVGAADFAVFPMIALALRMHWKNPELKLDLPAAIGPRLRGWMDRFAELPEYGMTYPPHWGNAPQD